MLNDYECITTFWEDFSIADLFGKGAILDTYNRVVKEWSYDYKYMTELVMVLNHKIWQHYEKSGTIASIYNDLWKKSEDKFFELFTNNEEAINYFYQITD